MATDIYHGIRLSTGKEVHANRGILGIGQDGSIYEGYEHGLWDKDWYDSDWLTKEEVVELSDHMIARWQKLKEQLVALTPAPKQA